MGCQSAVQRHPTRGRRRRCVSRRPHGVPIGTIHQAHRRSEAVDYLRAVAPARAVPIHQAHRRSEAVDYLRAVAPARAVPIHQAHRRSGSDRRPSLINASRPASVAGGGRLRWSDRRPSLINASRPASVAGGGRLRWSDRRPSLITARAPACSRPAGRWTTRVWVVVDSPHGHQPARGQLVAGRRGSGWWSIARTGTSLLAAEDVLERPSGTPASGRPARVLQRPPKTSLSDPAAPRPAADRQGFSSGHRRRP